MLWFKTFHIFFVVSWFACLLYLPRLFVNHASETNQSKRDMLIGMQHRLIKMMRFTLWGTVISAVFLIYSIAQDQWNIYIQQGWLVVKIVLVGFLIFYHYWCIKIHHNFHKGAEKRSHIWFRVFNEVPALLLLVIVYLVVAKPF